MIKLFIEFSTVKYKNNNSDIAYNDMTDESNNKLVFIALSAIFQPFNDNNVRQTDS